MIFENANKESIVLYELDPTNKKLIFDVRPTDMTFIWNTGEQLEITIDRVPHRLQKDQVMFLTEFHKIDAVDLQTARMVRFNQPFYCIVNHDNEVGSKGFLFFGASAIPVISLAENAVQGFEECWNAFCAELLEADMLQKDMLQSILKRMLIIAARTLRKETNFQKLDQGQSDIVREFNYLVERHFAEHHDVGFYADKLNRSPKTLSNLFSVVSDRAPLNIIHDRIMIHARRQINYTSRSIKEIAYDLGYGDIQTFSRFFKSKEGVSPVQYREQKIMAAN
ncbi:MAG: helix-turn-helix transcriptional regulator [Mucilaginibacter sp.]|nr:helix-turn-helix transcriptional regulator [Mucilaginibacter sp.]